MSGYILYGGRFTRAMICEMVFAELGMDYELREIDMTAREHRSDSYLAVNPAALIPSLVTPEGQTLYETPAISLYLAEKHGDGALAPLPGDPDRVAFGARLLWQGPFATAQPVEFARGLGVALGFLAVGLGLALPFWRRGRAAPRDEALALVAGFAAISVVAAYLVRRTMILLGLAAPADGYTVHWWRTFGSSQP